MSSKSGRERSGRADKPPQLPLPEIAVEDFAAEGFRVEDFVAQLAAPVLERSGTAPAKQPPSGAAPLADVKLLLGHFER